MRRVLSLGLSMIRQSTIYKRWLRHIRSYYIIPNSEILLWAKDRYGEIVPVLKPWTPQEYIKQFCKLNNLILGDYTNGRR